MGASGREIRRISLPVELIKERYDVVVVGSGYGGAIAASRMARAGRTVCLVERGREFQPGEYPDTEMEAAAQFQIDLPDEHTGSRTGLYDLRQHPDINVFVGCGLGGTSLVNASVAIEPDPRVFADSAWPEEVRADLATRLADGYQRAREMLKPNPLPEGVSLHKLDALRVSSREFPDGTFYRLPVNVTFADPPGGLNHVGVFQQACNMCGDCCSGCNHSAKNSVLMNYLPDAVNYGAEIFTLADVRWVEPSAAGGWRVHYQMLETGQEAFDAPTEFVEGDIVILAAGTLGSTEILLRSAEKGLRLSSRLGEQFTGNGDVLAFSYNGEERVDGVGWGSSPSGRRAQTGPTITGVIDLRGTADVKDGMVIEEGAVPGAVGGILPQAWADAACMLGTNTERSLTDRLREREREVESLLRGPYAGADRNTQTYLVMTHDRGNGTLRLVNDRLRVIWPDVGTEPIFQQVQQNLLAATRPLGGTYLPNPIWASVMGHSLITVHPLGGCPMGADVGQGVVNHEGKVLNADGGTPYDGLYVADGSVIPVPLGVNPLLTISAMTERCCALIAEERQWTIDYALPSAPSAPAVARTAGIQFTERMQGYVSTSVTEVSEEGYARGEEAGQRENSTFSFVLTVAAQDADRLVHDSGHEARMLGEVQAPALSADPLVVTEGRFSLFIPDPVRPATRDMRYRMRLTCTDGREYHFTGYKYVRDGPITDMWHDTTTLYVSIKAGPDESGPVVATGILRIEPADFVRQLRTMQVLNATSELQRLEKLAQFGRYFGGVLYRTYGGVLSAPVRFDPHAPPRKTRQLRLCPPELHPFRTEDGVELLLTRYRGGGKGPVLVAHGLGVSSKIFTIDTIETTLAEYLFAAGFDVWLLDFRASIDLPASATQFTADDVARYDYPAAVATVLDRAGATSVQAMVHCFGSTTFTMAMLSGLQGVRAAVCSQVSAHMVVPGLTRLKSGLHVPGLLERLGVTSMTALARTDEGWLDKLYDRALQLYPEQAGQDCDSAVCHRITFIYSLLYRHEQLDPATHDALHEMFGVANMTALDQLAEMVRAGHVVTAAGEDAYLPHLDRMAIPITFVHGAENDCFLPESTAITFDALRLANPGVPYARHVIPGYGHIDCMFGRDASHDVYPLIRKHLEHTA
ncbi:MAG TPA: GMC oxidoreductase [Streptosporangiaceae bacterium]|nr:GMC oxidoreductase [Streptosporangiaceae bacterium]